MEGSATRSRTFIKEIAGLGFLFWSAFLFVSLSTFSQADPSLNQVVSKSHQLQNMAGLVGAYTGGMLVEFFGLGSFVWPLFSLYLALACVSSRVALAWWRWLGLVLVYTTCITWFSSPALDGGLGLGDVTGGGFLGGILFNWSAYLLHPIGAALFWGFVFLLGLQLGLGVTWTSLLQRLQVRVFGFWIRYHEGSEQRRLHSEKKRAEKQARKKEKAAEPPLETQTSNEEDVPAGENEKRKFSLRNFFNRKAKEPEDIDDEENFEFSFNGNVDTDEDEPLVSKVTVTFPNKSEAISSTTTEKNESSKKQVPKKDRSSPISPKSKSRKGSLPSLDFLTAGKNQSKVDKAMLQSMGERLVACLEDFGIKGEIQDIKPGPVVTMFEYKPAPGIKISRIAGLADDLALGMKALAVRIDAIPGLDVVGIEVPNENREIVYLREIFKSDAFAKQESKITLALGKDIKGTPVATDLAKMPHLLVAGATGAGKSVCLNSILLSILYKASPEDVKLLLVDPKRIELSVYSNLPHLVHPVVTEMSMAKSALDWAVHEMDRRYQDMATLGVRNISGYNTKLPKADVEARPELAALQSMPYLVIIIDELADLMMTAGKEAEMSIVRLAQLARAAGIHLILATQRPSVDVVTGLIKANFPSRIAFQVTSKHDSRTILDMVGAEKLLGRGDSLFKPGGAKVQRVHGAYVDEDEIAQVVDFWKDQFPQAFDVDFAEWQKEQAGGGEGGDAPGVTGDPLYDEAVEFIMNQGKASISLIQRRFRIGYNRAARFIEQMESDGLLGPQEGSKPRAVIKGRE